MASVGGRGGKTRNYQIMEIAKLKRPGNGYLDSTAWVFKKLTWGFRPTTQR